METFFVTSSLVQESTWGEAAHPEGTRANWESVLAPNPPLTQGTAHLTTLPEAAGADMFLYLCLPRLCFWVCTVRVSW